MSLIFCDNDCIYQKDGYCILETPTVVSENKNLCENCIHYKRNSSKKT